MDKIREKLITLRSAHPFFENIVVLVSGNVLGYGMNILCLPIISRIYSPAQLGEYDLILSSGRFVMDFISLGLIIVVMLPKEDKKARQLCLLILAWSVIFLTAFFIILNGISGKYQLFETSFSYKWALLFLTLYLWACNMQNLCYAYTNRSKKYRVLFWNPLVQNTVNVGLSIFLGLAGYGTAGYLVGTIASYAVCCIHMLIHVKPFQENVTLKEAKDLLSEYKKIMLIQMPANYISQIGNEIPTQFLGRVFGNALLGGYMMANRILNVPVSLLGTPVNRVVYQTMAEKVNKKEDVGEFCFSIVEKNVKVAILPLGFLIIFGKTILPFVLGKSWSAAGNYIAILGIMFLLKFCSVCVSGTFVIMGKPRLSLIMSFISLVNYGMCFSLSYLWQLNVLSTITFFSVAECAYQFLNLVLCVYCTQYSMKKFLLFVLKYIVGGNLLIYMSYLLVNEYIF